MEAAVRAENSEHPWDTDPMFSIADRHHDKTKTMWERKNLFGLQVLIKDCNLGKFGQKLRQKTKNHLATAFTLPLAQFA